MNPTTKQRTERAATAVSRALSELDAAIGTLQAVRPSDAEADRAHALARSLQHHRSAFSIVAMSVQAMAVRLRERQ